jgi:hypothetical protein
MFGSVTYIFNILLYTTLSWVLIHILAILGIFMSLAFPIWWLISPKTTTCFVCRSRRNGEYCNICGKIVNRGDSNYPNPKNLRSAILNGSILFIFTLFSALLVFTEGKILYKIGFPPTKKTVSFIIPSTGQYRLGEIFPMKVEIAGIKTPVNAVQADIGFDPNKVQIMDISTGDSFANIFIQKEINNEVGYARLTGGLPNPGFFADKGTFGTIFFKGKEPGVVKIGFLPTSMVLANDGKGTNVLKEFVSVSYLVLPDKISEDEEKLQEGLLTYEPSVLGESNENTQIKFYTDERVLGVDTVNNIQQELQKIEKTNLIGVVSKTVENIDTFIINLWSNTFEVLAGKVFNTTANTSSE